jgi:hypothetical protein
LLVIRDATPAQQERFLLTESKMTNAKKTSPSDNGSNPDKGKTSGGAYRKFTFIAPYLDQNDKLWLRDNLDNYAHVVCLAMEQFPLHLRLSVKFDNASSRWLAILFDDSGDPKSQGVALSVRGATAIDAVYALAYLHCYKLSGGWSLETDAADTDPWG